MAVDWLLVVDSQTRRLVALLAVVEAVVVVVVILQGIVLLTFVLRLVAMLLATFIF